MHITITSALDQDTITIVRNDGETITTRFPKKGPLPHDAIHAIVETEMGLTRGFWGLVSQGLKPEQVAAMAAKGGHASAARPETPAREIVELIQAERLVECFEACLWDGQTDPGTLRAIYDAACKQSLVPTPAMSDQAILEISDAIAALGTQWRAHQRWDFEFI